MRISDWSSDVCSSDLTGVKLAVAVAAMLLAFVALVALANGLLGGIGGWFGQPDLSFQQLLGWLFAPVMFLIGIPWSEDRKSVVEGKCVSGRVDLGGRGFIKIKK